MIDIEPPGHTSGGRPGRILFLSHTHAFGPFRVGSHHYARALARRGAEVVHISTPISLAHRVTGRVSGETAAAVPHIPTVDVDGATHLVPRSILPRPFGRFRVAAELKRHGIDARFDVVLIDQPLLWDATVRGLGRRLIYRPTDLYPSGVKARMQRSILSQADGVIPTSRGVLDALGPLTIPRLVVENGVDAQGFTPPVATERELTCVYVGALDDRFDWRQVIEWAQQHSDVRFIIAGPPPGALPTVPGNVEVIGSVAYGALPRLLHDARVGLLPLSDDPLNSARSPMKLFEYLAAGLSVVARETPVLQPDTTAGVLTYSGPRDAATTLENALAAESPNTAGMRRAATESWEAKADALLSFIEDLPDR